LLFPLLPFCSPSSSLQSTTQARYRANHSLGSFLLPAGVATGITASLLSVPAAGVLIAGVRATIAGRLSTRCEAAGRHVFAAGGLRGQVLGGFWCGGVERERMGGWEEGRCLGRRENGTEVCSLPGWIVFAMNRPWSWGYYGKAWCC
jgi:hypothetical protein